jgi:hypothetical protein
MRHRFSVSVSAAALIVGSVSLAPVVATGQSRSAGAPAAAKKSTPPLTAWGKPDLEGVWDFRTVTPLERPSHLAGRRC